MQLFFSFVSWFDWGGSAEYRKNESVRKKYWKFIAMNKIFDGILSIALALQIVWMKNAVAESKLIRMQFVCIFYLRHQMQSPKELVHILPKQFRKVSTFFSVFQWFWVLLLHRTFAVNQIGQVNYFTEAFKMLIGAVNNWERDTHTHIRIDMV